MAANAIAYFTSTGDIPAFSSIEGVTLTAAGAAATCTIRRDGGSGEVLLTLAALANTSVQCPLSFVCGTDAHLTLSGAGAAASVLYV